MKFKECLNESKVGDVVEIKKETGGTEKAIVYKINSNGTFNYRLLGMFSGGRGKSINDIVKVLSKSEMKNDKKYLDKKFKGSDKSKEQWAKDMEDMEKDYRK